MTRASQQQDTRPTDAPAPELTGGMMAGQSLIEYNTEILAARPGLLDIVMPMLEAVPEPDGDATARIIEQIATAMSAGDLDAPWNAESMRDSLDVPVTITAVHKMPSDFVGGFGIYLVCQCVDNVEGIAYVLSTGSVQIVAQLARAHVLDLFPLEVIPRRSAKPTKNGFYPMHLEMVRRQARRRAERVDPRRKPDVIEGRAEAAS